MIVLRIIIDLGNIWEALSAVGTTAAAVIAMYLLFDERRRKISGTFVWDAGTLYSPRLMLCNNGTKVVAIKQIDFIYQGRKYIGTSFAEDDKYDDYRVLLPSEAKKVPIELPVELYNRLKEFEKDNVVGNRLTDKYMKVAGMPRLLVVKIIDCSEKVFRIRYKCSQREVLENFCGKWLFDAASRVNR